MGYFSDSSWASCTGKTKNVMRTDTSYSTLSTTTSWGCQNSYLKLSSTRHGLHLHNSYKRLYSSYIFFRKLQH